MNSIKTCTRAPLSQPPAPDARRAAPAMPRQQPQHSWIMAVLEAVGGAADFLGGIVGWVILPLLIDTAFFHFCGLLGLAVSLALTLRMWSRAATARREQRNAQAQRAFKAAHQRHRDAERTKLRRMSPRERADYVTEYQERTGYWHPYRLREPIT